MTLAQARIKLSGMRACELGSARTLARGFCVALGVSVFSCARTAHACSCATAVVNQLLVGNGKIASNVGGVAWWNNLQSQTDQFALERWNGTDFEPVPARLDPGPGGNVSIIGPEQSWVAGERYRIAVTTAGGGSPGGRGTPEVTEVDIVDPIDTTVPLALSVSATPVVGQVRVGPGASACSDSLLAASVQVTLPEPLDLYGSLFFTTRVNGQPYLPPVPLCSEQEPGASWQQTHGSDLIAAACGLASDARVQVGTMMPLLPEGTYTVVLEATLPDTSIVWRSNAVTVDLRCPAPADPAATPAAVSTPPSAAQATAAPSARGLAPIGAAPDAAASPPGARSYEHGCTLAPRAFHEPHGARPPWASLFAVYVLLRALRRRPLRRAAVA